MTYELYDTLDGRVVRVWLNRRSFKAWLARDSHNWLSRGYSYRRRWLT